MTSVPTYAQLRAYRQKIGAPWFTQPFDLNFFVARSGEVGRWDDLVLVAFADDGGREVVEAYVATGDAWEGEWLKPTNPEGCVFVLDQHVPKGLVLGDHKGRPALRQNAPFSYVRWPLGKGIVPTVALLEERARMGWGFTGICGTHVHNRVTNRTPEKPSTDDSEGCTVLLYYHQHASLIELVKTQKARQGSDVLSPTYCKLPALLT